MMKRGLLVYRSQSDGWVLWLKQTPYELINGHYFQLRLRHRYYDAHLFYHGVWCVELDSEVTFILCEDEVYKVRLTEEQFATIQLPF